MLTRAHWFGLALLALAAPFVLAQWGCQSTCFTQADCGAGQYCALSNGACLSPESAGFCQSVPSTCPATATQVCGCDGKQYLNECLAAQAKVSVATNGACGATACGGVGKVTCSDKTTYCHFASGLCAAGNATGSCDPIPTSCAGAQPSTVCGCDGKTYDSACEAAAAGASIAANNACTCGGPANAMCEPGRFCNLAMGTCTEPGPSGSCTAPPSSCMGVASSPVCGCDGKTYDNPCLAAKAQVSIFSMGRCSCGGPNGIPCAASEYCDYGLMGGCLDANPVGTCQPKPTSCSIVKQSVCGCDGNTYLNVCDAAMHGVSPALNTACPSPDGGAG